MTQEDGEFEYRMQESLDATKISNIREMRDRLRRVQEPAKLFVTEYQIKRLAKAIDHDVDDLTKKLELDGWTIIRGMSL